MSALIFLHTIGGHYTFEQVPFDIITNLFNFSRNNFDRIAHFTVGFYAYPIAEILYRKSLVKSKTILFLFPIFTIFTVAAGYEIIEWIYASLSNPAAGSVFLGSQGDIWDAQKDMLSDALGSLLATAFFFTKIKPTKL
jgi:putative membrane protein